MRDKTCKACKVKFIPAKPLQSVCGYKCALDVAAIKRNKAEKRKAHEERQQLNKDKAKLKTRSEWIKEVQERYFNPFIRLRDKDEPCISCGRFDHEIPDSPWGKWDCGHYLSRGAYPELRFEELNAHKQCKKCNGGSGKFAKKDRTVTEIYRINLINKIGLEKVEWLESKHEPKKYTIEELKELKELYKQKLKGELK